MRARTVQGFSLVDEHGMGVHTQEKAIGTASDVAVDATADGRTRLRMGGRGYGVETAGKAMYALSAVPGRVLE